MIYLENLEHANKHRNSKFANKHLASITCADNRCMHLFLLYTQKTNAISLQMNVMSEKRWIMLIKYFQAQKYCWYQLKVQIVNYHSYPVHQIWFLYIHSLTFSESLLLIRIEKSSDNTGLTNFFPFKRCVCFDFCFFLQWIIIDSLCASEWIDKTCTSISTKHFNGMLNVFHYCTIVIQK